MLVMIKGAGDIASGIALRLWRAGINVVMTDLPKPSSIRRTVCFSEAVYRGETKVEEVRARLCGEFSWITPEQPRAAARQAVDRTELSPEISAGVSNDTPDTVALRELRTGGRPLKDTEEDVPASIARAAALGKDAPRIYHTIGQEDSLLSSARETRDLLCSYPGDPFHYIYEEKPGKHGWEFCDGALRDFLQWLSPAPR